MLVLGRLAHRPWKEWRWLSVLGKPAMLFESEADLRRDLEVFDLAVNDVSTNGLDLEPLDVAERFRGFRDRVASAVGDALVRTADDLNDLVDVVCHGCSSFAVVRGTNTPAASHDTPRERVATRDTRRDTCCGSIARVRTRALRAMGYARAMGEDLRIERGWIFVNATRQDDGTIEIGTGGEMRFSPLEAMSQRQAIQITWGHILTASVQRLAFWRR
jgi:hypothetical protein